MITAGSILGISFSISLKMYRCIDMECHNVKISVQKCPQIILTLLCETLQIDQPDFQFPTEWNSQTNRSKFNSQVELNII